MADWRTNSPAIGGEKLPAKLRERQHVAIPLYIVIYYYFGLYNRLWRYATAEDLVTISGAVTIATAALFVLIYSTPGIGFPRSVMLISMPLNIGAVGGTRFLVRLLKHHTHRRRVNGGKPTLILGAGDAGRLLVQELTKHPELDSRIVGFLDDDRAKTGMRISGIPVLGTLTMLEQLIAELGIAQVIIAMPSAVFCK